MFSIRNNCPIIFLIILIIIRITKGFDVNQYDIHNLNSKETLNNNNQYGLRNITKEGPPNSNKLCEEEENPLDDLPQDLFTEDQRKHGAIIFHLLGTVYFFTLLAVVCNDYFLPAVECICNDLHISKHVAAATFMATATTMPEFFTNTISTLITESDMGIGTIIGSLMFNTLGVAAFSGMAISKPIQLDWWPVSRDCLFYFVNTIILLSISWGRTITFTKSLIMVLLCITYYVLMFMQSKVMRCVRVVVEDKLNCCISNRYDLTQPPENSSKGTLSLGKDTNSHEGIFIIRQVTNSSMTGSSISTISSVADLIYTEKQRENENSFGEKVHTQFRKLTIIPEGKMKKIWFFYSWPIKAVLTCIVPSPKVHKKLYPISFIMCIAFIGMNSYMIVWMLTVVGYTFRIPDTVMGMTFLAAGAATPETLSSLISVCKGESGIGVSNALGANSLAILLSLCVPWFIKNAIHYNDVDGNNVIHINSQGIEYSIGILLLSTVSLFIVMSIAGFRLKRKVGVILFLIYLVYITLQILIEMNVFFPKINDC